MTLFERFAATFDGGRSEGSSGEPWLHERLVADDGYQAFSARYAGWTFNDGLYRFHDSNSGPAAATAIGDAFPAFAERAAPFAFDWLGRQFALDSTRWNAGRQQVLLLEPGTGDVLEVPQTFTGFHDEELIDYREPALAESFFKRWQRSDAASLVLGFNRCAGYRVPLFLGGSDTVDNLETIDIDVYWTLCGQLREGIRRLPPGTSIGQIARG